MSSQPPIKGPLDAHLEPVLDDARIQAIARGVQAARHAPPRTFSPRFALAVSVAAGFLITAWLLAPGEPQPLALSDGTPLATAIQGDAARELKFSDGSSMSLQAQTQAEVVANQPGKLTVLLRQGKARFEVNPKAHRQWLVEAGLATVEVVGTIFTVERDAAGVRVSVERGTVVVRSEQLPDHLVRLEAAHSQYLAAPQAAKEPSSEPPAPAPVPERLPDVKKPMETKKPADPSQWRTAAAGGDFATAWAALERAGFETTVKSTSRPDELLALADTARSTGHDPQAAVALQRLLAVAPADPGTATAAFTLGRLELEKLNRPIDAAAHFAQAATSPGVGPLAEDALARRVEALTAAGQGAEARAAALQLLERFPEGAHAARLRVWLATPERQRP